MMSAQSRHTCIRGMARILGAIVVVAMLAACSSPPKPPEPTGQWVPVNPTTAQASRTQQK